MAFADRENNLEYIITELNAIFTKKRAKGAITFCTCHKSKGLENHRVFILTPERLPMEWKDQLEWQYEQEVNLEYVAYTRAKSELVIVNLEQKELMALKFPAKK
jgi:superfamily I DNA/RNA helicase